MHVLTIRLLRTLTLALAATSLTAFSALAAEPSSQASDTANATATESEAEKPPVSAKKMAQQARMKNCNAEAKTNALKGDERKAFMKTCLRAPKP